MAHEDSAKARLALRLWEATQTDAALLADLTTAYRGRHDLQDALWWRARPLASTPEGIIDPAAALRPLQDAVFSKAADSNGSGQVSGKAAELRALTDELARDGVELDAVLDRFGEWPTGAVADSSSTAVDDGRPVRPDPSTPARRAHPLVHVALGAVLGVLATIGVHAIQGEPVATDASSGSQTLAEYYETNPPSDGPRATGNVLQVFFRPPAFPDGVVPDLGEGIEPETIRPIALGTDDPGYQVYVARTVGGEYCLFLRSGTDVTISTCSVLSQLEQRGLWVEATLGGVTNEDDDLPSAATMRVVWAQDGTFRAETSPA
jgi:hypothetical protein